MDIVSKPIIVVTDTKKCRVDCRAGEVKNEMLCERISNQLRHNYVLIFDHFLLIISVESHLPCTGVMSLSFSSEAFVKGCNSCCIQTMDSTLPMIFQEILHLLDFHALSGPTVAGTVLEWVYRQSDCRNHQALKNTTQLRIAWISTLCPIYFQQM